MKKMQFISIIVSIVSIAGFILWRSGVPFSDWFVRAIGLLMLISIFLTVFTTVRMTMARIFKA